MRKYIQFLILLFLSTWGNAQKSVDQQTLVEKVNNIRSESHYCGRKWMPSVDPVIWNDVLFSSALSHAKEMKRYDFFAHYSRKGESIGDRLDNFNYKWLFAGENIAMGQKTIDETLRDWMKSKTHCKMIMSPHPTEIALAKYGEYRVLHLGRR